MPEAVFLDRDGTIVEDVGYGASFADTRLLPGVGAAIRRLNERGIRVVVVSNQAGVARGHFPESNIPLMHEGIARALAASGARIDAWYWCPHHPTEGTDQYLVDCACRKPKPGMLQQAAQEFDLDLTRCIMIGDKATDIEAGDFVGARTILVMTGQGEKEWASWPASLRPHRSPDLASAVDLVLADTVSI